MGEQVVIELLWWHYLVAYFGAGFILAIVFAVDEANKISYDKLKVGKFAVDITENSYWEIGALFLWGPAFVIIVLLLALGLIDIIIRFVGATLVWVYNLWEYR